MKGIYDKIFFNFSWFEPLSGESLPQNKSLNQPIA
jgi:hypothetical protein